jgi:hypothetical protein
MDPELREAGNLPAFDREALVASLEDIPTLTASGRLLALAAQDTDTGDVVGGGTLHHLDPERGIVEIGYFMLPRARGRGVATTIARLLAEHAFSLGIERAAAYVNVGNIASERVLDRAGSRARASCARCRSQTVSCRQDALFATPRRGARPGGARCASGADPGGLG